MCTREVMIMSALGPGGGEERAMDAAGQRPVKVTRFVRG